MRRSLSLVATSACRCARSRHHRRRTRRWASAGSRRTWRRSTTFCCSTTSWPMTWPRRGPPRITRCRTATVGRRGSEVTSRLLSTVREVLTVVVLLPTARIHVLHLQELAVSALPAPSLLAQWRLGRRSGRIQHDGQQHADGELPLRGSLVESAAFARFGSVGGLLSAAAGQLACQSVLSGQ